MTRSGPTAWRESGLDPAVAELLEQLADRVQAGEAIDAEQLARDHPEHAEQLLRLLPAVQVLAALEAPTGDGGPPAEDDGGLPSGVLGDFRLMREVGRGGMGIVYEAEQISLGRRVAVKVLPYVGALDARQLQRFRNEAKAAASLRHDHIVQVHAVGYERGMHFYAMEFIDGQTLARYIDGLRPGGENSLAASAANLGYAPAEPGAATRPVAALSTEPGNPRDKTFYRHAAALIAQAADALEHAHVLGVVHRDVKPGNLLLDRDGRLYVSDFGLARFGPDAGLTMSGDLLGTLRYMAPEQALAKHNLVDHRADIYGLGCTLYELLTGRPAVDGTERAEILSKLAFEEPVAPRKLHREVPLELETITLKCLAKNPAERYAAAAELADDLRRWLSDQTIRAKPPSLRQRAAKWVRRHRAMVATAACSFSVLTLTLVAAAAVSVWYAVEASRANKLAVDRLAREAVARQEAEANFRLARRAAKEMVTNLAGEARLKQADFHELRRQLLQGAIPFYEQACLRPSDDPALEAERGEAYASLADLRRELGDREAAHLNYEQARQIFSGLADSHPQQSEYRTWLAHCRHELGRTLTDLGKPDEAEAEIRAAAKLYAALADQLPGVPVFRKSMGICHNSLGTLFGGQRRWAEAEVEFRAALHTQTALSDAFPGEPEYRQMLAGNRLNLGNVYAFLGRLPEAKTELRAASEIYAALVGELPRDPSIRNSLATSHNNLGNVFDELGQLADAETEYGAALKVRVALADEFPRVPEYRFTLARSQANLAKLLNKTGRPTQALAEFREAAPIFKRLTDEFPHVPEYRSNLATCQSRIGQVLAAMDRPADAETEFRASRDLLAPLADEFPREPEYRTELALANYNLGVTLNAQRKLPQAEESYRQALKLNPDYAEAHCNLGRVLHRQGRFGDAVAELKLGHELGSRNPRWPYPSAEWVRMAERDAELDAKLTLVLRGEARPAHAAERLELTRLCVDYKKLHFAALRFYQEAFAVEPALADDMQKGHRYNAACEAALAGCGQGADAGIIGEVERTRLRRQALSWLRADLSVWGRQLDQDSEKASPLVKKKMQHWQGDLDFAGVRGVEALGRLPEAERREWQVLWDDVAALLKRAGSRPDR